MADKNPCSNNSSENCRRAVLLLVIKGVSQGVQIGLPTKWKMSFGDSQNELFWIKKSLWVIIIYRVSLL